MRKIRISSRLLYLSPLRTSGMSRSQLRLLCRGGGGCSYAITKIFFVEVCVVLFGVVAFAIGFTTSKAESRVDKPFWIFAKPLRYVAILSGELTHRRISSASDASGQGGSSRSMRGAGLLQFGRAEGAYDRTTERLFNGVSKIDRSALK